MFTPPSGPAPNSATVPVMAAVVIAVPDPDTWIVLAPAVWSPLTVSAPL